MDVALAPRPALLAAVRRGRTALAADRPFLRIDEGGVEAADGEHLAWPAIDRIDLVRTPGTPLDALPDAGRPARRGGAVGGVGSRARSTSISSRCRFR